MLQHLSTCLLTSDAGKALVIILTLLLRLCFCQTVKLNYESTFIIAMQARQLITGAPWNECTNACSLYFIVQSLCAYMHFTWRLPGVLFWTSDHTSSAGPYICSAEIICRIYRLCFSLARTLIDPTVKVHRTNAPLL